MEDAAVFYHKRRLYYIEGKALTADNAFDALRFQQSLTFTDSPPLNAPPGQSGPRRRPDAPARGTPPAGPN